MKDEKKISSYYKETVVKLIEKYKIVINQCLKIIEDPIDTDLKDDKLLAVIKAKRQAAEDAKYYAKEIDALQDELEGKESSDETKEDNKPKSWVKQQAR